MSQTSSLVAKNIDAYLNMHEHTTLLRFITCGSVDDGKSTLIGRLLYESKMLFEDQLAALEADSRKMGTQGGALDFALLVDGLAAEREQGITIDVAYRYFSTDRRKYIIADTPGHEQYTRNMITGASTADVAVVMVDARQGVLTQTRRHSYLASLIGIRKIVLAVNKMDLMAFSEDVFHAIADPYCAFAAQIGLTDVTAIPMSALRGDNVVAPSDRMPWYRGTTLMAFLESVQIDESRQHTLPFRLPVQWVNRPNQDFRGFAGTIASGTISSGARIRVQPSGRESTVARIVTADGDLEQAVAGQSITLALTDEIDISRGDMISAASEPASIADQFQATIVWMDEQPMVCGRSYFLKAGGKTVTATMRVLKHKLDINTMEHIAASQLSLNEIGVCELSLDQAIAFDSYQINRETGNFILIDRMSNATAGAGILEFALRRAQNIHMHPTAVTKAARARLRGQKPVVLWMTGLSGSGKSTIGNQLESHLHALGKQTYLLDGDNVRHGLNRDLGFTDTDRIENIRRVAEVAKLFVDAGSIVVTAFISPFSAERAMARALFAEGEFIEIFIDAPLTITEQRDPKGLYKKARRGELKHFTGIDSPYEAPAAPEIHIDTSTLDVEEAVGKILDAMIARGIIE
jgi:bifunctional enzyme CysN/CysC